MQSKLTTSLTELNALVCGSTSGIGLSTAQEFAASGVSVTLFARDEEKLKKLPHNQLVKEPLKSEDYAPSDLPPNEFMSTDAAAVPEPEKPKKLYDEYDSRFTESQ